MKEKITTAFIALIGFLAAVLFVGSINAYENGNIPGRLCFWQVMVALLLGMSAILLAFTRSLMNDYIKLEKELYEEIDEELNDYLIEEAEEVIIPDETFEFTRTPELDERGVEDV